MPPKDDPRSEREREVARLVACRERGTILNDRELHYAIWDAAIDAASKCAFNDEPELDILALKGDRNVEQSGTE